MPSSRYHSGSSRTDLGEPSPLVSQRALVWHELAVQADFCVHPLDGSDDSIPGKHTHLDWRGNTYRVQITIEFESKHYLQTQSHSALLTFPGLISSQVVEVTGQSPLLVLQGLMGMQCLPSPSNPSSHSHLNFPPPNEHLAFMPQVPAEHIPGTGQDQIMVMRA